MKLIKQKYKPTERKVYAGAVEWIEQAQRVIDSESAKLRDHREYLEADNGTQKPR